jgi:antitoxin component YwqK of YwqJK toxin-antitoxin module
MKKIILFIAAALLATIASAQEQREHHKNGQLMNVGLSVNGKKTGEWKSYHKNGQLYEVGKKENGKHTGEWKIYDKNGQLMHVGFMEDGERIGEWKNYHKNGQLNKIGKFENGKQTGEWKFYDKNGQLNSVGFIENGERTGEWKDYHKNGQLNGIGKLENGKQTGEWKFYDKNGQLNKIRKFENGEETGERSDYFSNGQLEKKYTLDSNGNASGNYVEYYDDGELRGKGKFVGNEQDGEWYQFEDGEKYKLLFDHGKIIKSSAVSSVNDPIEDFYDKERTKYYNSINNNTVSLLKSCISNDKKMDELGHSIEVDQREFDYAAGFAGTSQYADGLAEAIRIRLNRSIDELNSKIRWARNNCQRLDPNAPTFHTACKSSSVRSAYKKECADINRQYRNSGLFSN